MPMKPNAVEAIFLSLEESITEAKRELEVAEIDRRGALAAHIAHLEYALPHVRGAYNRWRSQQSSAPLLDSATVTIERFVHKHGVWSLSINDWMRDNERRMAYDVSARELTQAGPPIMQAALGNCLHRVARDQPTEAMRLLIGTIG